MTTNSGWSPYRFALAIFLLCMLVLLSFAIVLPGGAISPAGDGITLTDNQAGADGVNYQIDFGLDGDDALEATGLEELRLTAPNQIADFWEDVEEEDITIILWEDQPDGVIDRERDGTEVDLDVEIGAQGELVLSDTTNLIFTENELEADSILSVDIDDKTNPDDDVTYEFNLEAYERDSTFEDDTTYEFTIEDNTDFQIENVDFTGEVGEGDDFVIRFDVTNDGTVTGTQELVLDIEGDQTLDEIDSVTVEDLGADETRENIELRWQTGEGDVGDYTAVVSSDDDFEERSFDVIQIPSDISITDVEPTTINAGDTFTISIYVQDEFGNDFTGELEGFEIVSEFDGNIGYDLTDPIDMDENGEAVLTIDEDQVETADEFHTLTVDADDIDNDDDTDIEVEAGDPEFIEADVTEDNALADGEDEVTYTVTIADEFDNPVEDSTVSVDEDEQDVQEVDGIDAGTSQDTDEFGEVSFTGTSEDPGEFTIQFSEPSAGDDTATATFEAGDPEILEVSPNDGTATADGTDSVEFTVTVEDAYDNPVEGVQVVASDSGDDITIDDSGDDTTDESGEVTYVVTSTTVQEDVELTFEEQDQNNDGAATITFEPGNPDNLILTINDDTDPQVPINLEQPIDAVVEDTASNPIPGVDIELTNAETDDGVEFEGLSFGSPVESDDSGVSTFEDVVFNGDEGDSISLTFQTSAEPIIGETMEVTLTESAPDDITAEVITDNAVADGSDEVEFEVTILNEAGDPTEDATVAVDDAADVDSLGGLEAGDTATTTEDGVATFTATATSTGNFEVQFSETDAGTDTATATFVAEDEPDDRDQPEQAHFDVTITGTNSPVAPGEVVDIHVTVANTGESHGQQDIDLAVADFEDTEAVSLGGERSQQLRFAWETTDDDIGTHDVTVESFDDSDSVSVEVGADPPEYVSSVVEDESPEEIEITFDQDVSLDADTAGFDVALDGSSVDLTGASASADTVTLSLTGAVEADHSVSLSYDGESDNVVNEHGIEALPFSEVAVTVDVEVAEPIQANLTAIDPTIGEPSDEFSLSVTAEDGVQFSAADSILPDGDATYEWEIGDQTFTTDEPELSEQFIDPGTYSASVTVTVNGMTDTADFSLTVADETPPDAVLTGEDTVAVGEDPDLDAGDSTDNVEIAEYRWDFGDGTTDAGSDLTQPEHAFDEPGEYTVEVTVVDTSDNEASATLKIVVQDEDDSGIGTRGAILLLLLLLALAAGGGYYYMRRRR